MTGWSKVARSRWTSTREGGRHDKQAARAQDGSRGGLAYVVHGSKEGWIQATTQIVEERIGNGIRGIDDSGSCDARVHGWAFYTLFVLSIEHPRSLLLTYDTYFTL